MTSNIAIGHHEGLLETKTDEMNGRVRIGG